MMEDYLRYGLLLIGAVILFLILFESFLRQRRLKIAAGLALEQSVASARATTRFDFEDCAMSLPPTEEPVQVAAPKPVRNPAEDILVLSVFAKPNTKFASYELLQAIAATGLQFGDMNIFHYYQPSDSGRITLFSLASATKPGDFNLEKMGDFSCLGLTLFMDLNNVPDGEFAFNKMLAAAEQLSEDLDGELFAGPRKPLTSEILKQYQNKIVQFKH